MTKSACLLAAAAATCMTLATSSLDARTVREQGSEFIGKTIWTHLNDLTEIGRFPIGSSNPSFIIYIESLHPEDSSCSREEEDSFECERPDLCHIWVAVRDDLQPVRSEPVQQDPSRVLVAWIDEQWREGNGTHMHSHQDFDLWIEGHDGETLLFHAPIYMRYAPNNHECMAGVRMQYYPNAKNFFNNWPPR
jgi:hypothetical protein